MLLLLFFLSIAHKKKWNALFPRFADGTKFGGAVITLEDGKTILRKFLTCWRNESRNPHEVCLRKIQCPAPGRAQVLTTIGCQLKLAILQWEERKEEK